MNTNQSKEKQLLKKLFNDLWPLNRSITGNDVRKSHRIISKIIPLKTFEFKSGRKFNDWIIPKEWNVTDAYIKNPLNKKICDFKENNLHLMGYSIPINKKVSFSELKKHLFFDTKQKNAIPYKTSYYKKNWGFCIKYNDFRRLKKGTYEVNIDSKLQKGSLTISESYIRGISKKEILVHCYTCHPSMANNELSGPLLATLLTNNLIKKKNYFSYRVIFAPETIGSNIILNKYEKHFKKNLIGGFVCTCVGIDNKIHFKMTKQQNTIIDQTVKNYLKKNKIKSKIIPFNPSGSDERQYCSIGYNFPIASIMTTPYGKYKEYHTSLDNEKIISFSKLIKIKNILIGVFKDLEKCYLQNIIIPSNKIDLKKVYKKGIYPIILIKKGEPQLSRHNIHYKTKDHKFADSLTRSIKWLIHYSDGNKTLKEISVISKISLKKLNKAILVLKRAKLLKLKKI